MNAAADNASDNSASTAASGTDLGVSPGQTTLPSADKIIYSGGVSIETRTFDDALTGLTKLVADSGGFVENSSVTGASYDNTGAQRGYRTASYKVRIPAEKFAAVSDGLKALGSVTSSQTQADNITMQYTDTQAHLDALKAQEARLLELLAKAQSMSPTDLPGTGMTRTAVVLEFTMPMAASSAMMPAIVSAGVSPGMAIMSRPTEHTQVMASSFSIVSRPALAAAIMP